jgi:hypothetical protein
MKVKLFRLWQGGHWDLVEIDLEESWEDTWGSEASNAVAIEKAWKHFENLGARPVQIGVFQALSPR